MTNPQMALGLQLKDNTTLANYFGEGNRELLTCLHTLANGRGERFIYFWGTKGVGKTHLLQACCHTANKVGLTTFYLPLKELQTLKPNILEDLESLHLVCIDDVQAIAGHALWEEAFFNFFNRMKDEGKRLVIAGSQLPQHLGIQLPDLVSRLMAGPVFQVHELSDEQKIDALLLRARALGLNLSQEVAQFLFRRLDRDLGSLFSALNELDQASLAAKRKLTIPFVKSVLGF